MQKIEAICLLLSCLIIFQLMGNRVIKAEIKDNTSIHAVTSRCGLGKLKINNKYQQTYKTFELPKNDEKGNIKIEEVKPKYTEQDLYELTAVIYQEARGESDIIQLLVGNVVLNRVEDKDYANTVHDVLMSKHQYGMMWKHGIHIPNTTNDIENKAIERCRKNAIRLLEGERFCPKNIVYQSEFKNLGNGNWKKFKTKYGKTMYFNYKK